MAVTFAEPDVPSSSSSDIEGSHSEVSDFDGTGAGSSGSDDGSGSTDEGDSGGDVRLEAAEVLRRIT